MTTTASPLTAAALECAARGWRVFPLRPGGKQPVAGFTAWERHATSDPARIRDFWDRGQGFNIAIACGPSALVVLDLDRPKPGTTPPPAWDREGIHEGADVLAELCERHHQPFPFGTFTVQTRSGGTHLYFRAPAGVRLTNTAGASPRGLGWCIDTRAHGGYVVAPGSHINTGPHGHGDGRYTVIDDTPPAPLPEWLCRLLSRPAPASPPLECPSPPRPAGDLPAYAHAALQGEMQRVTTAAHGGRNHALNKAAYNLGRLVGAHILTAEQASTALEHAARDAHAQPGNPHPMTPAEIRATIHSGLSAGTRRPRTTRSAA